MAGTWLGTIGKSGHIPQNDFVSDGKTAHLVNSYEPLATCPQDRSFLTILIIINDVIDLMTISKNDQYVYDHNDYCSH